MCGAYGAKPEIISRTRSANLTLFALWRYFTARKFREIIQGSLQLLRRTLNSLAEVALRVGQLLLAKQDF